MATKWIDFKTKEEKQVVVAEDDGIRPGATAASLAKLPAVFKKGGSTTAANSSQVRARAACARVCSKTTDAQRNLCAHVAAHECVVS